MGGIISEEKTDLHVFQIKLTTQKYISNILEDYVVLFSPYFGDDFYEEHHLLEIWKTAHYYD